MIEYFNKAMFFIALLLINISIYAKPTIKVEPLNFDQGIIEGGSIIKNSFTIYNIGDDILDVTIQPTCDCTLIGEKELHLNKNESRIIHFEITMPYKYKGSIIKEFIINSNDPNSNMIFVAVNANLIYKTKNKKNLSSIITYTSIFNDELMRDENAILFFGYKNCDECEPILNELVKLTKDKQIKIYFYNLEDSKNKENLAILQKKLNYFPLLPFIILSGKVYDGKNKIDDFITGKSNENDEKIREEKLNLFAIIFSGLLDSINPCAFTVLILLISYLSLQIKSKLNILFSGLFYIFAIFVTYYLLGLGIFEFFFRLNEYKIISIIFKYLISIILILLAVLSFVDYLRIIKGERSKLLLKLPSFLQNSIRKNIREQVKNYRIIAGSLFLGFIVAILEVPCTGQIYFTIIGYMARTSAQRIIGNIYLIIYNIVFILPLILIFILIYTGISSKKIGDFFAKNLYLVKISFVLLFLILSVINFMS